MISLCKNMALKHFNKARIFSMPTTGFPLRSLYLIKGA